MDGKSLRNLITTNDNMNKFLKYTAFVLLIASFFSCDGGKSLNPDPSLSSKPSSNPKPVVEPGEQVMDAESQGEIITKTATQLMDEINSTDFNSVHEMIKNLVETDFDNYDSEGNQEIIKEFIDAFETCKKTGNVETWLYSLYGVRGKYIAKNGKISFSESKDFELYLEDDYIVQVSFSDKSNLLCVYSTYNYQNNNSSDYYVDIPENIELAVIYKGKEQLSVSMKSALNFHSEFTAFDPQQDSFNVKITISTCGYTFSIDKICYESGTAQVNMNLFKADKCLFSEKASFKGVESENSELVNINETELKIDILGKVQLAMHATDMATLFDCIDALYDDIYDRTEAKRIAKTLNDNIEGKVFYGSDVPQAVLGFEPITTDSDQSRWTVMPVILIGDQSYQIVEYDRILSDSNVDLILSMFEDLCDEFYELVEDI